jgi:hypothetical protein
MTDLADFHLNSESGISRNSIQNWWYSQRHLCSSNSPWARHSQRIRYSKCKTDMWHHRERISRRATITAQPRRLVARFHPGRQSATRWGGFTPEAVGFESLEPACKPLHEMRRVDLTICDVAIGSSSPHRQYLLRPHSNYTINHVLWEYQQSRRRASLTWISSSWYCCQNTSSSHPVCSFLI